MNFSRFERYQLKHLAAILKCNSVDLEFILENINDSYYEYQKYKKDKDGITKTFKDGTPKKRTITPSFGKLKIIQTSIKRNILDIAEIPLHIQGGVKGKSNISNAKIHQGKKYKLTTDLQDFFPRVKNGLVYSVFLRLKFTNIQANWLTKLTTYKYGLPQGAPTSPHLSNLAFIPTDNELLELCRANGITYTRFIDDLTFSSPLDFQEQIEKILSIITTKGFKVSQRKTFYCGKQTITGIEVSNNHIDAPFKIREKAKVEASLTSGSRPFTTYVKRIRKTNKKKGGTTKKQ
jgi:RNA-directed DNA polymerase